VEFTKIRSVKTPNRANAHDAGTDFYIPDNTPEFIEFLKEKNKMNNLEYRAAIDAQGDEITEIVIPAGEQIMIPSGIKVNIHNKSTFLIATNKSGIASKYHLVCGACVIDADYQGEIHMNMLNVGNTPVTVYTGMKIVQFIHEYFVNTDWQEITNEQYDAFGISDRGAGGFGSTTLK